MFEKIINFFKNIGKVEEKKGKSKDAAKERLHLVLMQDRANVSADFLELMKQEIIDVIKKYIDVDENAIDVRLTNKTNEDGTNGAPALYANIPITNMKSEISKPIKEIEKVEEVNNDSKNNNTVINAEVKKDVKDNTNNGSEIKEEIKEEVIVQESDIKKEAEEIEKKEAKAIEEIKEAEEIKEKIETENKNDTEEG